MSTQIPSGQGAAAGTFVLIEIEQALAESIAAWRDQHNNLFALVRFVADASILKGAVLVALALSAAARTREPLLRARNCFLLRFSAAALAAIAAGRFFQTVLPHRDRPIVDLSGWASTNAFGAESSFPSDHAVFMTAMATAIWFVDRRVGVFAFSWAVVVILLPRILLNYHFPTDILAGAVLGAMLGAAVMSAPVPAPLARRLEAAETTAPHLLYPLAFLLAFALATNLQDLREGMRAVLSLF